MVDLMKNNTWVVVENVQFYIYFYILVYISTYFFVFYGYN